MGKFKTQLVILTNLIDWTIDAKLSFKIFFKVSQKGKVLFGTKLRKTVKIEDFWRMTSVF
jgi:hypothetical protein